MILAPLLIVVYSVGMFFFGLFLTEFTVVVVFVVAVGVLGWIGYTMFTEPPSPRAAPGELDDLGPETIDSPKESESVVGHSEFSVVVDSEIGEGTVLRDHVNLYKCKIGKNCKVESFVYIEEGVTVGDRCKLKPHVFIPSGVTIEDDVFIGPNVTFTNDKHPQSEGEWKLLKTVVGRNASIGAGAVILPGLVIGRNAMVGAGSVVTRNVQDGQVVHGNPARPSAKPVLELDTSGQ